MATTTFSLTKTADQGGGTVLCVTVRGELDSSNSMSFKDQVIGLVSAAPGTRLLRLDCAGLHYISSTGVGAFMEILKELRKGNRDLVIVSMTKQVFDVIDLLGLSSFLDFESA
jgi:anti-sigma B factor antagonist